MDYPLLKAYFITSNSFLYPKLFRLIYIDNVEVFCKLKMKHKFLSFDFEPILLTLYFENSINIASIPFFCISFLSSYIVIVV